MPIDPEQQWTDAFANLATDKSPNWAMAFASAVDERVTGKAQLTGILGSVTFTFNKALFATQLMSLSPSPVAPAAMMGFANAWATAMSASQMVVAPGSAFGAPAPPTLWSVIFTSMLDAPMIQSGKAFLASTLSALPPAKNAKDSKFGATFRSAFLMCTASITGLNSLPIPPAGPGPLPFAAPFTPLQ